MTVISNNDILSVNDMSEEKGTFQVRESPDLYSAGSCVNETEQAGRFMTSKVLYVGSEQNDRACIYVNRGNQ